MINTANQEPDDTYTVNGKTIGKFVIYGMVKAKVEKTTSFTLTLDDGTGRIDATRWVDADESSAAQVQRQSITEGSYVCVNGVLKSFSEKRYMSAFNIRLVTDHNELTHHFMDVIFVNLQITSGPLNKMLDPNVAAQMKVESPVVSNA
jgi:replication factor A2